MKPLLFCALTVLSLAGCAAPPTPRADLEVYPSTGKILYVGALYDLRQDAGPRVDEEGQPAPRSLADQREIRIPISEIRSVVAHGLDRSQLFERVLNPPFTFAGNTPDLMVHHAQQSSDYLLVGEVNQFHIKAVGFNASSAISIPGDLLFAPLAFATFLTTGGNMYLFSGALMSCWDCEVLFSLSASLIDAGTGQVVHTIRLEERVRSPYDGNEAFGALWDESDDWIDLGRRLGELALHNASVRLSSRLNELLTDQADEEAEKK